MRRSGIVGHMITEEKSVRIHAVGLSQAPERMNREERDRRNVDLAASASSL